jgi:hypothetical protein
LAKIVRDNVEASYRLYLLAQDEARRNHAVISFPALSMELVTDSAGIISFSLPAQNSAVDWNVLQAILHLAVAEHTFSKNEIVDGTTHRVNLRSRVEGSEYVMSLLHENGILRLDARRTDSDAPVLRVLIVDSRDNTLHLSLDHGTVEFRAETFSESLSIRLFDS